MTPIAGPLTRETDLCVCRSDGPKDEGEASRRKQKSRSNSIQKSGKEGKKGGTAAPWPRLSSVQKQRLARETVVIRKKKRRKIKSNKIKKIRLIRRSEGK